MAYRRTNLKTLKHSKQKVPYENEKKINKDTETHKKEIEIYLEKIM